MERIEVGKYLVVDPRVCSGRLSFKGTRVPAELVLYWLAQGNTIDEALGSWPHLKREAVEEAVVLAAAAWPGLMREWCGDAIKKLAAGLTARATEASPADGQTEEDETPPWWVKEPATPEPVEIGKHLVVDPRVCFGRLTFKGTRIPVTTVLEYLALGKSIRGIRSSWPQLSREAITEAIELAEAALVERSGARRTYVIHEPDSSGRADRP